AALVGEGLVHEFVAWPRARAARADAVRRARAWRPELAFVLPASFSSAWLAWASGARARIGYRGEWRDALLTQALAREPRGARHLADEFLALGASRGVREAPVPLLAPTAAGRAAAASALRTAGLGAGGRYASPGPRPAFGPAREWFAERFMEAGRGLVARGLRVLVCGTRAEAESCAAVAAGIGPGAASIAGETDLMALVAVAAGARLPLSHPSALPHLPAP